MLGTKIGSDFQATEFYQDFLEEAGLRLNANQLINYTN